MIITHTIDKMLILWIFKYKISRKNPMLITKDVIFRKFHIDLLLFL